MYREFVPNEKGQRLEQDMGVTLDAAQRGSQAVEPVAEVVVDFAGAAAIEPGIDGVGEDRRLGRTRPRGQLIEPPAQRGIEHELMTDTGHGQNPGSMSEAGDTPVSMPKVVRATLAERA